MINAKAVHPHYVAIRPLPIISEENVVEVEKTEQDKLKEQRKQNVGIVVLMGSKCDDWIKEDDQVSFYRNAATPVPIPGSDEILLVHEDHILVKFGE